MSVARLPEPVPKNRIGCVRVIFDSENRGLRGSVRAIVSKRLATYFHCPTEFTLAVLGGKWKTVILSYLKERPCGYAELRRLVPALSDKVLSERLRELTRSGLVGRHEPIASRTQTYYLTEKGRSLSELLQQLYVWGLRNSGSFGVRVGAPLEELDAQQEANGAARSARLGKSRSTAKLSARTRRVTTRVRTKVTREIT